MSSSMPLDSNDRVEGKLRSVAGRVPAASPGGLLREHRRFRSVRCFQSPPLQVSRPDRSWRARNSIVLVPVLYSAVVEFDAQRAMDCSFAHVANSFQANADGSESRSLGTRRSAEVCFVEPGAALVQVAIIGLQLVFPPISF